MKRLIRLFLVLIPLLLVSVADAGPKTARNVKSLARVAAFPFVHPAATAEGFIYAGLKIVGSAVDVVERGAAAVHAGVSKVDETIDKIEDVVLPPAPVPSVPPAIGSNTTAARSVAIPGCSPPAFAFVPKGCYSQTLADLAEVRCPGQTNQFRCLGKP